MEAYDLDLFPTLLITDQNIGVQRRTSRGWQLIREHLEEILIAHHHQRAVIDEGTRLILVERPPQQRSSSSTPSFPLISTSSDTRRAWKKKEKISAIRAFRKVDIFDHLYDQGYRGAGDHFWLRAY